MAAVCWTTHRSFLAPDFERLIWQTKLPRERCSNSDCYNSFDHYKFEYITYYNRVFIKRRQEAKETASNHFLAASNAILGIYKMLKNWPPQTDFRPLTKILIENPVISLLEWLITENDDIFIIKTSIFKVHYILPWDERDTFLYDTSRFAAILYCSSTAPTYYCTLPTLPYLIWHCPTLFYPILSTIP